jgi:hypothetical protein
MRRREFITLFGGAAWPFAARTLQTERVRRIGVLQGLAPSKHVRCVGAFRRSLSNWLD